MAYDTFFANPPTGSRRLSAEGPNEEESETRRLQHPANHQYAWALHRTVKLSGQPRVVLVSAPRMLNELHGAEPHGAFKRVLRRYV